MASLTKATALLPLAAVDKCVGAKVLVLLRDSREFRGVLRGFDAYMNLLLEDAEELSLVPTHDKSGFEKTVERPGTLLLNGNGIAVIVPCGDFIEDDKIANLSQEPLATL